MWREVRINSTWKQLLWASRAWGSEKRWRWMLLHWQSCRTSALCRERGLSAITRLFAIRYGNERRTLEFHSEYTETEPILQTASLDDAPTLCNHTKY